MTDVVSMATAERTLPELVGWVRQEGLALNLSNDRLAFLIAISALSRDDESHELTELALHDAFGYVSQIFGQMDETLVHRANNAINEFVRQKLLSRFNADPVEGESLYRLTRLAVTIVEFYVEQKEVSSIKLSLLLEQVASELTKAFAAAREDDALSHWNEQVYPRLKFSVEEILARIDLTQRAMDEHQNQVKVEIADLLNQEWTQAIHSCEKLLRETGQTLRELQDTLDAAGHKLQAGLLNIQEACQGRDELRHIEELTHTLQVRLDAIISWGQQCIELWARYDRHVHKFIRTAIDMDKNRAFSQRLRDSIRDFQQHNWLMVVAQEHRLLELRDETLSAYSNEVTGDVPTELEYHEVLDVNAQLVERIQVHIEQFRDEGRPLDMAEVLREYLTHYPQHQHFDVARLLIDAASRLGFAGNELDGIKQPKWKPINEKGAKVQAHVIDHY